MYDVLLVSKLVDRTVRRDVTNTNLWTKHSYHYKYLINSYNQK